MNQHELVAAVETCGSSKVRSAVAVVMNRISGAYRPCVVTNCFLDDEGRSFGIEVLFPSAQQSLPLLGVCYRESGGLLVQLLTPDQLGDLVAASENLAGKTGDLPADIKKGVDSAIYMLSMLAPPEPNGAGLM